MKKNIETETYRFVGDSRENLVLQIHNRKTIGTYTQTSIIRGLTENKQYVVGGKKLKSSIDNPRQAYLIYYGRDKEDIEQIIKIIVDKKYIEMGDPNALAIDGMCLDSINIKIKNWAIRALAATSIAVMMTGLAYGMVKAGEKEAELQKQKTQSYFEQIDEHRKEKGLAPLGDSRYEIEFDNQEDYSRSR